MWRYGSLASIGDMLALILEQAPRIGYRARLLLQRLI
jgi:hypothetical protein